MWTPSAVRKTILFCALVGIGSYLIIVGQAEAAGAAIALMGGLQALVD